jgi:hypothetical protein
VLNIFLGRYFEAIDVGAGFKILKEHAGVFNIDLLAPCQP